MSVAGDTQERSRAPLRLVALTANLPARPDQRRTPAPTKRRPRPAARSHQGGPKAASNRSLEDNRREQKNPGWAR
jgi:hypothetical protein